MKLETRIAANDGFISHEAGDRAILETGQEAKVTLKFISSSSKGRTPWRAESRTR